MIYSSTLFTPPVQLIHQTVTVNGALFYGLILILGLLIAALVGLSRFLKEDRDSLSQSYATVEMYRSIARDYKSLATGAFALNQDMQKRIHDILGVSVTTLWEYFNHPDHLAEFAALSSLGVAFPILMERLYANSVLAAGFERGHIRNVVPSATRPERLFYHLNNYGLYVVDRLSTGIPYVDLSSPLIHDLLNLMPDVKLSLSDPAVTEEISQWAAAATNIGYKGNHIAELLRQQVPSPPITGGTE